MLSLVCLSLVLFLGIKTSLLNTTIPLEHTIFVEGIGKATMTPDIAVMSFGISSTSKSVADAQKDNSSLMNALLQKIKAEGIADADLQTKDYSAYEKTEWNPQTQKSENAGWTVSQTLSVKIRDLQKISRVVEIAGQNGSTSISGPVFTIDNQTAYESTAREKALADAKTKADAIAQRLGLHLARVIGYSEYKDQPGPQPYGFEAKGMGGAEPFSAPNIQGGSQELQLHATVTYLLEK